MLIIEDCRSVWEIPVLMLNLKCRRLFQNKCLFRKMFVFHQVVCSVFSNGLFKLSLGILLPELTSFSASLSTYPFVSFLLSFSPSLPFLSMPLISKIPFPFSQPSDLILNFILSFSLCCSYSTFKFFTSQGPNRKREPEEMRDRCDTKDEESMRRGRLWLHHQEATPSTSLWRDDGRRLRSTTACCLGDSFLRWVAGVGNPSGKDLEHRGGRVCQKMLEAERGRDTLTSSLTNPLISQ